MAEATHADSENNPHPLQDMADAIAEQAGQIHALEAIVIALLRSAGANAELDGLLYEELERAKAFLLGASTNQLQEDLFDAARDRYQAARKGPPAD